MAIYHLATKPISRSGGRSAVAAAAYRASQKLTNERDGLTHDFTHRHWLLGGSGQPAKHAVGAFSST